MTNSWHSWRVQDQVVKIVAQENLQNVAPENLQNVAPEFVHNNGNDFSLSGGERTKKESQIVEPVSEIKFSRIFQKYPERGQ